MNLFIKIISLFIIIINLYNCKENKYIEIEGEAQGTTFSIKYFDKKNINYENEIIHLFIEIDRELSHYNPNSLITNFNNNIIPRIDLDTTRYFKNCLSKSNTLNILTKGYFDITLKNITDYLESDNAQNSSLEIILSKIEILNKIDKTIHRDGSILYKIDSMQKFDFDAIAQGYTVDIISSFLESKGIDDYLVEVGGEIKCSKKHTNEYWNVEVVNPEKNGKQLVLNINNKSVATSGSYIKTHNLKELTVSHILNPKNIDLKSENSIVSITVIANDCMTADALATAFYIMGKEKSFELIEEYEEFKSINVLFIEKINNKYVITKSKYFNNYINSPD